MTPSFIRRKASSTNDPAIIFLHGVGSGKEGWHHQIDPVLECGWQFVAVDAPGYGATPLAQEAGFQPHVESVLQVLDHLELETAVICGHSLGGMTAQEVAAHSPNRVSGLILSATSPAFGRTDGAFQQKFLSDRLAPFDAGMSMPEFAKKFAPKLVGSNASQTAIDEIQQVMKSVPVETYRIAMQTITTFDCRHNLPLINVPTLLIAGEQDNNSPATMMQKMATKITTADYAKLSQTGHMGPIENPADFNQHLQEFLKRGNRP